MTDKPTWWPKNPYPDDIFVMPRARYAEIVPDPTTRTALSGTLGREFWEIASDMIWDAMQAHEQELRERRVAQILDNRLDGVMRALQNDDDSAA